MLIKNSSILAVSCLFLAICSNAFAEPTTYFVSPTGNDAATGTLKAPFRTIEHARDAVRRINANMTQDIDIYLRGGTYSITQPIEFGPSDSGTNGHTITYQAYKKELPIISGGVSVSGWRLDHGNVYKAPLNRPTKLRNLFVNGIRANMTAKQVQGRGADGTFTIAGTEPWADNPGSAPAGIVFSASDIANYRNPEDVELDQQYTWNKSILCASGISQHDGNFTLILQQPGAAFASAQESGTGLNPNGMFTIRNAYELLGASGDFYFDRPNATLYYIPRDKNLGDSEVVAPVSEGLLKIDGLSTAERVHDIAFDGLTFEYDDWQLESVADSHYYAGLQSTALSIRYTKNHAIQSAFGGCDLPQATVDIRNASNIKFESNIFEHLSSGIAINLANDVISSSVVGNLFYDLSGNAVNVGHPQHAVNDGSSKLFPKGVMGICRGDVVADNLIRNISQEFPQEEAVSSFFVDDLQILHNDILGSPYGSIAVGWGWSGFPTSTTCRDNTIGYNRVISSNQILQNDGGPIYTLGQQPNSKIIGNYVKDCPREIYTDEGSSYIEIEGNVCENAGHGGRFTDSSPSDWYYAWTGSIHDDFVHDNYANSKKSVTNGTNCPVVNTHFEPLPWSSAAQAIIDNAGLEPQYRELFAKLPKGLK